MNWWVAKMESVVSDWTQEELQVVDGRDEVTIATERKNGTL